MTADSTRGGLTLIDNYDSFTHTLADYCRRLGVEPRIVRNDRVAVAELSAAAAVVISPGPGRPEEAGVSVEAVRRLRSTPILGVCLGHQAIVVAVGGEVVRAAPCHGRCEVVVHDGHDLFEGLPSPLSVGRYHSLAASRGSLPPELRVTARTEDGGVMAVQHMNRPVFGVQFHPESVLTQRGELMVGNFLAIAGFATPEVSGRFQSGSPAVLWGGVSPATSADDFYERPAAGPTRPI